MNVESNDSFIFSGDAPVGGTPARQPFPTLRAAIAHKRAVTFAGALLVALLCVWLALRSGWVELYPLALVGAAVAWFGLRAAVEVVELVAETLMPR